MAANPGKKPKKKVGAKKPPAKGNIKTGRSASAGGASNPTRNRRVGRPNYP